MQSLIGFKRSNEHDSSFAEKGMLEIKKYENGVQINSQNGFSNPSQEQARQVLLSQIQEDKK
jgi:hypothetical protein